MKTKTVADFQIYISVPLMFCFWVSFLADVSYLEPLNAKGGDFRPDWYVIFHAIWFLNTN